MKKTNNYSQAIQAIKNVILKSRYRAAALANKELLYLYFTIGEYVSSNTRNQNWGKGAIEIISEKLQQELPGLRGFSPSNIKNMRLFFEEWKHVFVINQQPADKLKSIPSKGKTSRTSVTSGLQMTEIRQPAAGEFTEEQKNLFLSIGFTHHCEIIAKTKSFEERMFYIERCAMEFWNKEKLKYYLKSRLYTTQGKLPNNFNNIITDKDLQRKALLSFKDEYLLDYINIESPDDEPDERVLESEIVNNIRKFIMSLGKDFSFVGSQYRLVFEEREFFLDLLFFNRQLQCLVAIELKRGDFKPEYMGKMNFYLSVLDDSVKLPHENPSIGIILCKTKNKRIVEFSFRDMTKPMGVATYKTASKLPPEYKKILPDAEQLKELL